MQPVYAKVNDPPRWMIGVLPQPKLDLITTKLSFLDALGESVRRTKRAAS